MECKDDEVKVGNYCVGEKEACDSTEVKASNFCIRPKENSIAKAINKAMKKYGVSSYDELKQKIKDSHKNIDEVLSQEGIPLKTDSFISKFKLIKTLKSMEGKTITPYELRQFEEKRKEERNKRINEKVNKSFKPTKKMISPPPSPLHTKPGLKDTNKYDIINKKYKYVSTVPFDVILYLYRTGGITKGEYLHILMGTPLTTSEKEVLEKVHAYYTTIKGKSKKSIWHEERQKTMSVPQSPTTIPHDIKEMARQRIIPSPSTVIQELYNHNDITKEEYDKAKKDYYLGKPISPEVNDAISNYYSVLYSYTKEFPIKTREKAPHYRIGITHHNVPYDVVLKKRRGEQLNNYFKRLAKLKDEQDAITKEFIQKMAVLEAGGKKQELPPQTIIRPKTKLKNIYKSHKLWNSRLYNFLHTTEKEVGKKITYYKSVPYIKK